MITEKNLRRHPGLNPDYFGGMKARKSVQKANRDAVLLQQKMRVPPQPNKYVPHYGSKEAAKYAERGTSASRLGC
jgi:hypothetical protein